MKKRASRFVDQFPLADLKSLEISNAINTCYNSQRASIGRAYESLGFKKALGRSSLLHTLYLAGRPMTHGEIRAELEITQGSVTFLVDGLEKEGLVSRTTDSTDRRVVYVELTADGHETCQEITPAVVDLFGRLGSSFSDAEKDQFLEYLFRFLNATQEDTLLTSGEDDQSNLVSAAKAP
ncbi:MAG TPA: MarR family transcriptional regulator [Dehalococcoidia bacterium]|nr:MarR family transcriptional regulator [Dehalococcoidia bacterium]